MGRRLGKKRLGLQIEIFGGSSGDAEAAPGLLLCPSGPVRCDLDGLAGAETWAREQIHGGHGSGAAAGTAGVVGGVGAMKRLVDERPAKGRRCVVLM